MKTRADAWALLTEFTQSQPLRRDALAVEATMRHLARASGVVPSSR
jgi:predicted hydrolase (HD superfamily)